MNGKKLEEIRKAKKFTKKKLGESSGVHYNTIKLIESGKNKDPRIRTLESLAKPLGVSVNDFI